MLSLVFGVLAVLVTVFVALLLVRFVVDWIQVFARDWRPRGAVLVVAEVTYTVTDPPIRAVRRVVPPLTLGSVRLDLAYLIVFMAALLLRTVLTTLAITTG